MKSIFHIYLLLVTTITFGQKTNGVDYKHIFCEERYENDGVIWRHCDFNNERFTPPDTIKLFRQENREKLIGVEKCGTNSQSWRFFNKNSFKEILTYYKDDTESELLSYKVSYDKKSKKHKLTIRRREKKKYVKYSYFIYKIFQDSKNVTQEIILVKTTNR